MYMFERESVLTVSVHVSMQGLSVEEEGCRAFLVGGGVR